MEVWAALPPKEASVPMYRRLGGPQSWSGRCGEEQSLLPLRESNSGRPARTLSLHGLSYPGSPRKRCNLRQFKLPLISVTVLASVDTGPYQILTYTDTPRSSYLALRLWMSLKHFSSHLFIEPRSLVSCNHGFTPHSPPTAKSI
jgi:hypothetical protein